MKDSSEETVGLCKDLVRNGVVCQLLHDNVSVSGFTEGFQFQNRSNLFHLFEKSYPWTLITFRSDISEAIFDSREFQEAEAILWPDFGRARDRP